MITSLTYFLQGLCISASKFLFTSPLDWNWETSTVSISGRKSRFVGWYCNVGVSVCYEVFLVVRLIQTETGVLEASTAEKAVIKFWVAFYTFQLASQLALLKHYKELPGWTRRFMGWATRTQERCKNHPNPEVRQSLRRWVDLVFATAIFWDGPSAFLWIIPAVLIPEQKNFLTSIGGLETCIYWRFFGTMAYAYIILSFYSTMYVGVAFFIPWIVCVPQVLRLQRMELHDYMLKAPRGGAGTVTTRYCALYRETQLIVSEINATFCDILIPGMKCCVILGITYCLYGFIALDNGTRWLLLGIFIGGLGFLEVFFGCMGRAYTESKNIFELIHRLNSGREFRRNIRTLMPIKIKMRNLYFVDEKSAMIMLRFTAETSIGFIIASRLKS